MYVREPHACLVPLEVGRGTGSPGVAVTGDRGPPHDFWETDVGPLREQQVLMSSEPSLQPRLSY